MSILTQIFSKEFNLFLCGILFVCVAVASGYNLFGVYDACKSFSEDDKDFIDGTRDFMWVAFVASILCAIGFAFGFLTGEEEMGSLFISSYVVHALRLILIGLLVATGVIGIMFKDMCADIEDTSSMTTGYVISIIITSLAAVAVFTFLYPFLKTAAHKYNASAHPRHFVASANAVRPVSAPATATAINQNPVPMRNQNYVPTTNQRPAYATPPNRAPSRALPPNPPLRSNPRLPFSSQKQQRAVVPVPINYPPRSQVV